eukprot:2958857-Amphidinium_carterae.1
MMPDAKWLKLKGKTLATLLHRILIHDPVALGAIEIFSAGARSQELARRTPPGCDRYQQTWEGNCRP